MKVWKCPICGVVKNRKGEFFLADPSNPLTKGRIILHIAVAHPEADIQKVEKELEIVEI